MKYKKFDHESFEISNHHINVIMRVGEREHLSEFREGRIRFMPPAYYASGERKNDPFFDKNEGLVSILQSDQVRISLTGPDGIRHEISTKEGLAGQVLIRGEDSSLVLCFHAIHGGPWISKGFTETEIPEVLGYLQVPGRMDSYGDHVCVILKPDAFFERLRKRVKELRLGLVGRLVQYINFAEFHGDVPEEHRHFVKSDFFKDEREYRLKLISPEKLSVPFYIDVGDLSDITKIVTLEDFRKSWYLRYEDRILNEPQPT